MEEFRGSLHHDLTELQLNPDVYLDHVLGLLYYAFELNGDVSELRIFLQECQFEEKDSNGIANRMYQSFHSAFSGLQTADTDPNNNEIYNGEYVGTDTYAYDSHGVDGDVSEYFYDENAAAFDLMYLVDQTETLLQEKFNWTQAFPPEVICLALHKANNDVSQTATMLMESVNLLSKCKPCRHLLQHRCVRSDCFFDHDLSGIPCKYWLYYGTCTSAESCLFMHDLVANSGIASSECISQKVTDNDHLHIDSSQFPTLSGSLPATMAFPEKTNAPLSRLSKTNSANTEPLSNVSESEAFPSLTTSISLLNNTSKKQQKKQKKSNNNISETEITSNTYLDAINKPPAVSFKKDASDFQIGSQSFQHNQFSSSYLVDALISHGFIASKTGKTSQQYSSNWKEGGEVLRQTYETFREEATALAKARNMYLQQATQAYLIGDRSNARTFSKKGQDLNREMKQAHRQAALILFQSRNADVSKLCNDGMIDLHGLHVSEAEELMEELLPIYLHYYQHQSNSSVANKRKISIITGSGHHSITYGQGNARLLPKMQELVRQLVQSSSDWRHWWSQQDIKDGNGYVSGILLKMK